MRPTKAATSAQQQPAQNRQVVARENRHEATALRTWNGVGAVRLLDHDPDLGALLLERIIPGTPLSHEQPDRALDNANVVLELSATEGDDVEAINAKSQVLTEASMKLGQAMYEAQQAGAAEADAKADAAKDDDVVDADFEEIDEDGKKKSA